MENKRLFDYNIFLIGFMGCGKSTIAGYLHDTFSMDVVEMDDIIAKREGMSISDIFETHGEQYFRDLETNLLVEMQNKSNVVISCGGGQVPQLRTVSAGAPGEGEDHRQLPQLRRQL